MRWGIFCHGVSVSRRGIAKEVMEELGGEEILVEKEFATGIGMKGFPLKEINKLADVVIVIGGDGTILRALQYVDKPIFTVNTGELGFLAEVEPKFAAAGIERIRKGDYQIEERIKLKVCLGNRRLPDATNEVTLHSIQTTKIMEINVRIDGNLAENFRGDGLIVATPTGSTGYALAVGGPIVDPLVEAFVIAPIAPFRLSSRPLVTSADKEVTLEIADPGKHAQLAVDDIFRKKIGKEQPVRLTRSERKARFVRFGESFYQKVRMKLLR